MNNVSTGSTKNNEQLHDRLNYSM
uniref:Uncharacterized protein n=1 Tax=Anguilla anguilla TaxID=7936 RepID=A0A0E9PX84_ANGAN